MPRVQSSWLMGSVEQLPQQEPEIDGSPQTISSGPYYLTHANPTLSLLDAMVAAMTSAGVAAPTAVILENRRVRLGSSGTFEIDWSGAVQLRDFLGFTINLADESSYIAPQISPYLWSGGCTANRDVIPDVVGWDNEDVEIKVSADGTRQEVDFHTTHIWDEWSWDAIVQNRYDSPTQEGGLWNTFRRTVIVPGHRIQLYEPVIEDSAGTNPVVLPDALATYRMRSVPLGHGRRKISNSNAYWSISAEVRQGVDYA